MGIQHSSRPVFGAQWHPESICSTHGQQIIDNFREIALEFWARSAPWNRWTHRHIGENASLPDSIMSQSAIVKEAREVDLGEFPPLRQVLTGDVKPYYIKAVNLGEGPAAKVIFDAIFRHTSLDGEAWLDSARVSVLLLKCIERYSAY